MGILDYRFRSSIPSLQIPLSNATSAASRLPSHGSGPGRLATPRRFIPTLSQTWGLPHKFCNIPDVGELNGISQHWLSHFCVTALDTYRTTRWPASAPADALRGKSHSG